MQIPDLTQVHFNSQLLVMWGALLFHSLLPIPHAAHPMRLWRAFAQLLADQVNKKPENYAQSQISGSLALLLMLVPAWIILEALIPLVWQPALFDLALLILALDWRNHDKHMRTFLQALHTGDKEQSRQLLAGMINRQTSTLSPLGLGKAGVETLLMGYARNVIAVMFWFAIGGGVGAFLYRLVAELGRQWSPNQPDMRPFGLSTVRLLILMDMVPFAIFSLLLLIGRRGGLALQKLFTHGRDWINFPCGWLLIVTSFKLDVSLGGPAIYGEKKIMRTKLEGSNAPDVQQVWLLYKWVGQRVLCWLFLQTLITTVIYYL